MPNAPVSYPKPSRLRTQSIKARLNEDKTRSMTVQRVKKAKHQAMIAEIISDDEQVETSVSSKKPPLPPVIGEYLLTARTYVGIQMVYRESQSTMKGHQSARRYFDESIKKVETAANERGIEPVLQSSTATIYSKSMKPADYITNDVNKPKDWYNVESVVNHLAKSLSKGIRADMAFERVESSSILFFAFESSFAQDRLEFSIYAKDRLDFESISIFICQVRFERADLSLNSTQLDMLENTYADNNVTYKLL